MALTGLDVCHVADVDLALLMLGRHDAAARSHDQNLIAIVDMPPGVAAPAEVHHGAVVVLGLAGIDDGLASPKYWARPARGLLGRTFGRDVWDVLKRDNLHDARLHCSHHRNERPNRRPVALAAHSAAAACFALRASMFARAAARRSSNLASRRFGFACTTLSGCPGSFCDPAQPWAAMSKMIPERSVCLTSYPSGLLGSPMIHLAPVLRTMLPCSTTSSTQKPMWWMPTKSLPVPCDAASVLNFNRARFTTPSVRNTPSASAPSSSVTSSSPSASL